MDTIIIATRVLRAIWNGPFHIGRLSQPVSVGDVLLKVLETFWRAAVAIVGGAAAVAGTLSLWFLVVEPVLFPPLEKSIAITVRYDDGKQPLPPRIESATAKPDPAKDRYENFRCTSLYPLLVEFTNNSSKTVKHIGFEIAARYPDHSDDLANSNYLESDAILKPHYSVKNCYSVTYRDNSDIPALVHSAKVSAALAD